MIVIFAEKPSQARAYAEAFTVQKKTKTEIQLAPDASWPNGAVITWGVGHLVELQEPKKYDKKWTRWTLDSLPIIPEKFQFQISKGKYKQFQAVKKWFQQASLLINACDVDREGSNIFYSTLQMTGVRNKPIQRLWINSLEVEEIRRGFQQLRDNTHDLRLYDEAKTRQVSDWLVGMNASRLYTILLKEKGFDDVFPIGRVQSPTVYLVYERMKEIERFVSRPFFELHAKFQAASGHYEGKVKGRWETKEELVKELLAHNMTEREVGTIQNVQKKEKRQLPPLLHSLSTLQATANRKWKMSPNTVLQLAQKLYERKLISYPRTDTRVITNAEFAYVKERITRYQELVSLEFPVATDRAQKRYVNDARVKEHYAIIPTKQVPRKSTLERMNRQERLIYEEIVRTTLGMFHRPYLYEETTIETDVRGFIFHSKGVRPLDEGWKMLFPQKKETKQHVLPHVVQGERVEAAPSIHEGKTEPPKPYTEGQLITLMKTCGATIDDEAEIELLKEIEGIGTEATRSSIIETIKRHAYIDVKKNIVSLTPKGRLLCEALEGTLLASPSMTAKWEKYLKKIGEGTGTSEKFLRSMEKFLHHLITTTPQVIEQRTFDIKGFQPRKKKAYRKRKKLSPIARCPKCQKGDIVARKGFYGCTEYRNGCRQTFPGTFANKELQPTHIRDICEKGKTDVLEGFVSNQGKPFTAAIIFRYGRLELDFRHLA